MPVNYKISPGTLFLILVLLSGCCGCSGVKTYPNDLPKNLRVTTAVDSGAALKSTVAEFDIHLVNAKCETDYLGRVYLDKPGIDVGIPESQPLFLDFIFASKAFLSGNISAVRYQTLLTPRPGYEYTAQVSYLKGIYNVVIREKRRGAAAGTTIPRKPFSSCKPGGSRGNID